MDNSQTIPSPYVTLIELSRLTGIRCGTLQRRAIRGILPGAIKLGRDWFYPRALVEQVGTFGRGRKLTRVSNNGTIDDDPDAIRAFESIGLVIAREEPQ